MKNIPDSVAQEALKKIPQEWHAEFITFIDTGEASKEFLAYLENSKECSDACEMVLRADTILGKFDL